MGNSFLNNYFGFNKQQRNGLFVLILISFALLVMRLVYPIFIKPDNIVLLNLPLIEKQLDSTYSVSKKFTKNKYNEASEKPLSLFVFDPNAVSYEQLVQLGFKEKTAHIFLKYRSKGFFFKEKEDLKKVYGISDKLYSQIEPYILISPSASQRAHGKMEGAKPFEKPIITNALKQTAAKIELNTADSARLVSVNGIGPGYAKRILKYRQLLGGYVAVEQLKEVYGLSEEVYEKIKMNFSVEAVAIKRINLNKDDFKVLNKHPYLSYEMTKSIFDWRRKTTLNPSNLKDILNDAVLYNKLLPYLSFD